MERILVLNDTKYPSEFIKINVTPPPGISMTDFVENRIITAVNNYNPKLSVTRIEYEKIENQFPNYKKGNRNGVLVEEAVISASERMRYIDRGYYVYTSGTVTKARKIMMYIMISQPGEPGRNAFSSQTVFPTLLDYIDDSMNTATYGIADHDFCFINISNKVFTANMILRHVCSLYRIGIHYVETFANSIDINQIPKDLKSFMEEYASDFSSCYTRTSDIYEDDNYKIDFKKQEFQIKASDMISKLITTGGVTDFNGSSEKFYWIEIYPMSIYAYTQGYKVDYKEYEDFVVNYRGRFSLTSDKFARCETLLAYFKKFFL